MRRRWQLNQAWPKLLLAIALGLGSADALPAKPPASTPQPVAANPADEVMRLFREGMPFYESGNPSAAEPLWRRGLELAERELPPDHPYLLMALTYLGHLYHTQGRFADAEPLMRRALESNERFLGPDHLDTISALTNLAGLYGSQDRDAEGDPLLQRALETAERTLGGEHQVTLTIAGNMAVAYVRQDRFEEAERLFRRGLEVRERRLGPDHPSLIPDINNLGLLYLVQRRYAEAEPLLQRALQAAERTGGRDHPDIIGSLHNLGRAQESLGRYVEAEALYRRALEISERALGRDHQDTLRTAENLVIFELERDRATSLTLDTARLLVTGLAARQSTGTANQTMLAQAEREAASANLLFAMFADIAWSSQQDEAQRAAVLPEAFATLQRSVLGAADRSIARQAARRYATGQRAELGALIGEREELERQWSGLDNQVAASYGIAGRPAAILQALEQVQARIRAIDARLSAEAPDYFALIRPDPLDIPAARALLDADEAFLLVVPSGYGTHVVAVTRDDAKWWRSEWNAARVRTAVQQLRWDAGASVEGTAEELATLRARPSDGPPGFDRMTAFGLHQELIAPGATLLAEKSRIYIAAGGALAALPFQLMVSARPSGADNDPAALRETHWLGDDAGLVHIPSLQSLALLRRGSAARPGDGFVGIGDPVLEGTGRSRDRGAAQDSSTVRQLFGPTRTRDGGAIASVGRLRQLARLPGTARELEAVRQTLGAPHSALMLAERATELNVRAADLSQTRILLFSTHGLTATESVTVGVSEAGLVLTPPLEASEGNDGFLAASEVTTLNLNADWVILSACNTATGDGTTGAGLGGLSRAFFYAGARNVLASHWPVSDDVAPILITRTLELEGTGIPRAEAFRQAMRRVRMDTTHDTAEDSWAHPFYWAPFVLIGDGGA